MTIGKRPGLARLVVAAAVIGILAPIGESRSAVIVGRVADTKGAPVVAAEVLVQDLEGKVFAKTVTDPTGHYEVHGLEPGAYNLIVRGQSGVAYLGKEGLTINWGISETVPPVAIARQGIDEPRTSSDEKRPVSPMSVEGK